MSEPIKEYIECRIFILGDENVGKKSFAKRILNLPSTGVIRNTEAEEEYDKLNQKINEEIEKDRIKEEQQRALLASMKKKILKKIMTKHPDSIQQKLYLK